VCVCERERERERGGRGREILTQTFKYTEFNK